jgi:hypothetical protein
VYKLVIKLYDNEVHVLTILPDDPHVYLRPCNYDDVAQHWAWQGGEIPAIGKESGSVGWGPYSVGIVNATSLLEA